MDLQKILRIQVGFLTVCQLVLIITGAVYGVLVAQAYNNDGDCVVGFSEVDPGHFETTQIVLLSIAAAVLFTMIVTRFKQEDFFSSKNEDMYQYPMLITSAMIIGISYAVGLMTAFTGVCTAPNTLKVKHIEAFAWITLSILVINFFLSATANLSPMKSESKPRDMINWSSIGSVHLFRFIFLVTLTYVLRDSVFYDSGHTDNHEINIGRHTGSITSQSCLSAASMKPSREVLDKFELISFFGDIDDLNNTVIKVTANDGMTGAVYTGLAFTLLSSLTVGVAIRFRPDFTTYTLNVPGIFEKITQIIADIIVALAITSLILENELAACQPWNLDKASIQCLFVSAVLLMYVYITGIFISTVRRIDGVQTYGSLWTYNAAYAMM